MRKHPKLVLIGERIRAMRKRRGFSQEAFALETGVARGYFGGVERGERNLAVLNVVRIADALNVEVGDLFPTLKELRAAKGGTKLKG